MTCENCDPKTYYPGKVVRCSLDLEHCYICGSFLDGLVLKAGIRMWDQYFYTICIAVASKSPCLSRHIGAILVRDHSIVSTGFNGPSRGIPHCTSVCPRKFLGYASGTHLELCPAQHAEENAISNAARLGISTIGTTLYMNCIVPCKNCFGTLINAGIVEIVVDDVKVYDKHTQYLIDNSNIKIRRFEL